VTSAFHRRFFANIAGTAVLLACIGLLIFAMVAHASDEIPPEASVQGVIGHAQSYTLSCESRSAADWSAYFGANLSESEILSALPRTDNPETGFVGSPSGDWGLIPPRSYGVHPPALAKVLREKGVPAQEQSSFGWDALRREIAARKPVIVWVIGQMWNGTPIRYTAGDGQTTTVAYYEHVMILVGYTSQVVHVVDAYSGADQYYDINTFLTSWGVLGERAITYAGDVPQKPAPVLTAGGLYTVQRGETLSAIAQRHGISWLDLASLNGLGYPYLVYAGQQIKIPGWETDTVPSTAPTTVQVTATNEATATIAATPTAEVTSPPEQTVQPTAAGSIVVRAGDTLLKLARKYQVAWQDLVQANRMEYPYFIYPGQVLNLPPAASGAAVVTETSTLQATQATPVATAVPVATANPDNLYTVQRGDYLIDLARRFGLDWQTVAEINGIGYPYRLYPGQVIKLR
jgi:LysM repeat protein/uncharacterized protein YvpB